MNPKFVLVRAAVAAALVALSAAPAAAQAYIYPAFQPPRVVTREFNFGLGSAGDAGTSLVFQMRNASGIRSQFTVEGGFADSDAGNAFFLGGQYAHQLATATATTPLDFLLTIAAGFTSLSPEGNGDNINVFRVPVGVVIGNRFPLEGAMSLTPYAHPRLLFENCGDCGAQDDTEIGVEFDVGADLTFSPTLSMRFGARLGGTDFSDENGFGISLAYRPSR